MSDRLTMTSDKGGVALVFDLNVDCQKSEMIKILKLAEKLKQYEEIGTPDECRAAVEKQSAKQFVLKRQSFTCQICGMHIFNKFCSNCGQKIAWSDAERGR